MTIVPYHLRSGAPKHSVDLEARYEQPHERTNGSGPRQPRVTHDPTIAPVAGSLAIDAAPSHERVAVSGRIVAVRVQPWGGAPTLEATLRDASGELTLVFLGRRQIGGIIPGTMLTANGVIGLHQNRVSMLNPEYRLLSVPHAPPKQH